MSEDRNKLKLIYALLPRKIVFRGNVILCEREICLVLYTVDSVRVMYLIKSYNVIKDLRLIDTELIIIAIFIRFAYLYCIRNILI